RRKYIIRRAACARGQADGEGLRDTGRFLCAHRDGTWKGSAARLGSLVQLSVETRLAVRPRDGMQGVSCAMREVAGPFSIPGNRRILSKSERSPREHVQEWPCGL